MTQWVFSPVCVFVYECVCGAGSGGRDGALWQPHHHGDSGIIVSGGHWCWSGYSIGSRKEQHGNDRIHWAAGQTSGCMSHRALGNASSFKMPFTVNFSGFTVILVTPSRWTTRSMFTPRLAHLRMLLLWTTGSTSQMKLLLKLLEWFPRPPKRRGGCPL